MFFYTVLFRFRKKLQAKEKQLPAEKTNTSYNFYVRGFSGLEGRQKLCTLRMTVAPPARGELTIGSSSDPETRHRLHNDQLMIDHIHAHV
jgi:hypothetical protein